MYSNDKKPIFLDFLDFQTTQYKQLNYEQKHIRLKYELLAFPRRKFLLAAPAIAKCQDTAFLATLYAPLWDNRRFKFVLSPEYEGSFTNYVDNRLRKLHSIFPDYQLPNNFEYVGYTSPHWHIFFEEFLSDNLGVSDACQYRKNDCDTLFRDNVFKDMQDNTDTINYIFRSHSAKETERICEIVSTRCKDQSSLFQRDSVMRSIKEEIILNKISENSIDLLLDLNFAKSNAEAVDAITPSAYDGINGDRLSYLSRYIPCRFGKTLFDIINMLAPNNVLKLSQQSEWEDFIDSLNNVYRSLLLRNRNHHSYTIQLTKRHLPSYYGPAVLRYISIVGITYFLASLFGVAPANIDRLLGSIFHNLPSYTYKSLASAFSEELMRTTNSMRDKVHLYVEEDKKNQNMIIGKLYLKHGLHFNIKKNIFEYRPLFSIK